MEQKRVFIIAEAGDNHNGSYENALKLVDKAVEAGADCVKFQTFITENVISKFAEKAEYQKENTNAEETQFEMVKKLELSFDEFRKIKEYCDEKKILFLSTPFDLDSIDFLQSIDIPFWKIPSGEITNLPYNGSKEITVLHCNTEYPTPFCDVNLNAMKTIKEECHLEVGYSDHTIGIEVPIAAVAMGACVIEKHFTLDKNMEGPDHKASLEPEELKEMVIGIRTIEKAMGNGKKCPSESEQKNIIIARKSIVANCDIKKGEILTEDRKSVV